MGLIAPTLPTSGEDRGTEEVDAINTLQTIVNVLNGNLDPSNLAASVFGSYKTLHHMSGWMNSGDGTGLRVFDSAGLNYASGASISGPPRGLVVLASSPWALTSKVPKLRLTGHVSCNNVAPGAGTLTLSLRPATVSGTAGAITVTGGTAVTTVALTPVQAGQASNVSADIDVPAVGLYIVCAQMSVAFAANAVAAINADVSLHHV